MSVAPELAPELTPGAMMVVKERTLRDGGTVTFSYAPAGWLTLDGTPRRDEWRRYHYTAPGPCDGCDGTGRATSLARADATVKCRRCAGTGQPKRAEVTSVTTICDRILPKPGLPPWSEAAGIRGAVEAMRRGLIDIYADDEDAVRLVRGEHLGADAARDQAADRGLDVHALLEAFMLTGSAPNPVDHPESHRPFIRGLVRWLLWAKPEPVAVELLVCDPLRGYAGRLDLLAMIDGRLTLVDLKTQERGSIYESAHVQTRLYWAAEARCGEHEIETARVVVVNGTGGFDEMDLLADEQVVDTALAYYALARPIISACESRNRVLREAAKEAAA